MTSNRAGDRFMRNNDAQEAMKRLREVKIKREIVFSGKMLTMCVDAVKLPNGREATREVVLHPGAVAMLAITEQDEALLVSQLRYALDQVTLELPAGKLEPEENPDDAAFRELAEETGYRASGLKRVLEFYTAAGFSDEKIYLYEATGLKKGEQHLDEDETIDLVALRRDEVRQMIDRGQITDAKTLIGLFWWLGRP